jgi:hypothetical protein
VRQMCGGQATPRGLPSHRPFARRRSRECAGGVGTTDGANEESVGAARTMGEAQTTNLWVTGSAEAREREHHRTGAIVAAV